MPLSVQREEIINIKTVDSGFSVCESASKARAKSLPVGTMFLEVWLERKKNCRSEFKGWKGGKRERDRFDKLA